MNTYREIVYMILDEIKSVSDDSYFEEEHVVFLMNTWRATLLSQRYGDIRRDVSIDNYQTICLDLEDTSNVFGYPCEDSYLKSVQKIPGIIKIGAPRVHPLDFFSGDISLVSSDRFRYTGNNKFLKNVLYSTIGPDGYIYVKSANPQHKHLEKVNLTAVFSDPSEAFELRCDKDQEGSVCDIMDTEFPLENKLVSNLIQVIVKELLGASYRPQDSKNNAADDMSDMASFLYNATNRDFRRQLTDEE